MSLSIGMSGKKVVELQELLNLLPANLPRLAPDGKFGPKTLARVREFQSGSHLVPDGIVGPLTLQAITNLLSQLGLTPPPPDVSVWPITQQILGMPATNGLIQQIIPAISIVDVATFRPGVSGNTPLFSFAGLKTARLGIFAARKKDVERAVILLLPGSGTPDRMMIGISHGFGGNAQAYYDALGWQDPLSPPLIQDVLLRHVIKRWGAEVLAGKKSMGLMHIVRAAGKELGPFAQDGQFVRDVLTLLQSRTGNAFTFGNVEAFTFSSGIGDFNPFLQAVSGTLNIKAVYNLDPAGAVPAMQPTGSVRRQFLSGMTGGPRAGFEYMPLHRWKNDPAYPSASVVGQFQYLHNHCMPDYALHLGIQTS